MFTRKNLLGLLASLSSSAQLAAAAPAPASVSSSAIATPTTRATSATSLPGSLNSTDSQREATLVALANGVTNNFSLNGLTGYIDTICYETTVITPQIEWDDCQRSLNAFAARYPPIYVYKESYRLDHDDKYNKPNYHTLSNATSSSLSSHPPSIAPPPPSPNDQKDKNRLSIACPVLTNPTPEPNSCDFVFDFETAQEGHTVYEGLGGVSTIFGPTLERRCAREGKYNGGEVTVHMGFYNLLLTFRAPRGRAVQEAIEKNVTAAA